MRGDERWIQTFTGRRFWPLDPDSADVVIEDVAHALAMKCRFGGHCVRFYSVAQHSVLVSLHVPPADAMWGLLHDAAEAYLPDVVRPIKRSLAGFGDIELRIEQAVAGRFGVGWPMPGTVKESDTRALKTEMRDLMYQGPDWTSLVGVEPFADRVVPLSPEDAKAEFLQRFDQLMIGRS